MYVGTTMVNALKLVNRMRRGFMKAVDKNYVEKKLAGRKGKCLRCGLCCKGCKFLDEKTKMCKVYNNRPWTCHKDFPLDEFDQRVFGVEKSCRYTFK